MAVAWFNTLREAGFLSQILPSSLAEYASLWLFGLPGCVLVLSSIFMPIVIVLTVTYLKSINPHLEERGTLGIQMAIHYCQNCPAFNPPGILLLPSWSLYCSLGELRSRVSALRCFPVQTLVQFSAFYNFGYGTATALLLVIFVALILMIEGFLFSRKQYQSLSITSEEALTIKLGRHKWWLFALVSLICLIFIITPLLTLVLKAGALANYAKALQASVTVLSEACILPFGALLLVDFWFFVGLMIYYRFFLWRQLDFLTIFLLTLPSTVIGAGLIVLWNNKITNFSMPLPSSWSWDTTPNTPPLLPDNPALLWGRFHLPWKRPGHMVGAGWLWRTSVY